MRVKTDPKLMNNPEAQCTAYYLDFFKCADACVRQLPSTRTDYPRRAALNLSPPAEPLTWP